MAPRLDPPFRSFARLSARLALTAVCVIGLALSGWPVRVAVAAPANDNFAGALDIAALFSGPYTSATLVTSGVGGATREADETRLGPTSCASFPAVTNTRSVWFSFTAPADGWVTLDTRLADYDTVLEVWTGPAGAALNALDLPGVACDDDSGKSSVRSEVTWAVTTGTPYYIMVRDYGANNVGGSLVLRGFFAAEHQIYVDQAAGDDANNTGSATLPYKTITLSVSAVTVGGAVNVADGAYPEAVLLDKDLTLRSSSGAPTALSFELSNGAELGGASGGVTAPAIAVGANSRVADGLLLAADSATVTLAAGAFTETVTISQSVTVQGPAAGARAVIAPASGAAVTVSGGSVALNHLDLQGVTVSLAVTGGDGVTVYRSNLTGAAAGLTTSGPAVDAAENWWGDASGPAHAINPGGAGLSVSDGVTFSPWCSAAAPVCAPLRGLVAELVFDTQPARVKAGAVMAPAVVVEARDAGGNVVTGYTGTVALSLGGNPGGAALSGTLAPGAVAGAASFGDLSVDKPGLGYTVVASATVQGVGVITATSAGFDVFNNAPLAGDDTGGLLEDAGAVTVNMLANDSDPDPGDTLAVVSLTPPAYGTATAGAATLVYTPTADFFGTDVFTYTVTDPYQSGIATATVTVTVTAVNDPPSFTKGADQTVAEDAGAQTVAGWATGISAGPANESGQAVTFVVTTTNAALFSAGPAVSAAGQLTFTPAADASGSATVSVFAGDDGGVADGGVDRSITQTLTITVQPVNDAPSFGLAATAVTVTEDSGAYLQAGFATGLSAGPADEAGQTLTFQITTTNDSAFAALPALDTAGQLTFTPAADAFGPVTVFARLHDNGGTANSGLDTSAPLTFTVAITPVNDPPLAGDDARTILEDGALSFDPRGNDSDPDQDTLNVMAVGATGAGVTAFTTASVAFTPTADYNGTTVFTYTLSDGAVPDTAVVTVTVTAVNDAPSFGLAATAVTVTEDSGAYLQAGFATGLSAGPADEAGQTLTFQITTTNDSAFAALPALDTAGQLTFTPAADAFGPVTVFARLHDNGGTANSGLDTSAPLTFTVAITPVNDRPDFTNGGDQAMNEDAGAQTVAGWALPINPGPGETSQTLTFAVTTTNAALFSALPAVNAAGTLTYQPAADASGQARLFVSATDDGGVADGGVALSLTRTLTLTVNAVNDGPAFTLASTAITVTEDSGAFTQVGVAGAISAGPADEAGQTLTFAVTNTAPALFSLQPSLSQIGTLTFTPAPNAAGTVTVTVQLQDNGGTARGGQDTSAPQALTIHITPMPDAPLAAADSFTLSEDTFAELPVLGNDVSPDQGTLSVLAFSDPANGAAQASAPIRYTPDADFFGADSLTYTLTDTASGLTATTSVSITVLAVNDPPTFTKGVNITVTEDAGAVSFFNWPSGLSAGPANEAAQTLAFGLTNTAPALFATQPAVQAASGLLTFTPASNASGVATVTIALHDDGGTANSGQDTSAAQTFTITVTAVNDPPTVAADSASVSAGAVDAILAVLANDSAAPDVGETLTITAAGPASHGTVTVEPGGAHLLYTPAAGYTGADTFSYTVSDGNGGQASATVTVTVAATTHSVFLPTAMRAFQPRPDLVGSFSLSPANPAAGQPVQITIVITNQGTAPASAFWVDFYINPSAPPSAANQPWDQRCSLSPCYGLAWLVSAPLGPGASVTLTSTPASYFADNTRWPGAFASGTNALYLYVDSWNPGVATGAVAESAEGNNIFAQTGFGPLAEEGGAAAGAFAPGPFQLDLPPRPESGE